jgi:hypothetical protein
MQDATAWKSEEGTMSKVCIMIALVALLIPSLALAGSGSGDFSVSYLFLDEEGNQSVNQSTFNVYEGAGISVENFRYTMDNGLRVNANLRNIILNNRNLWADFGKPGLFGVQLTHNQYRRVYSFDGSNYIRRHNYGGLLWANPVRYLKVWGGGNYIARSGSMVDLFGADPPEYPVNVDYDQFAYKAGFQFNYMGGLLRFEYRGADYNDNENSSRDQTRSDVHVNALMPVPNYKWIVLFGGFRHFKTELDSTDFGISSNRGWGGFRADLPQNFQLRYNFIFDRTSSDSDFVATDNITNTVYLSHVWPRLAQLTAGYQNGINDDFEDEVKLNSFFLSGWVHPMDKLDLRGQFGITDEDITDGTRLVGPETRTRYKISGKYNADEYGLIAMKFENKKRKNEDIDTRVDYVRYAIDYSVAVQKYGTLSAGYMFAKGDFQNREDDFEFTDNTLYGDIATREYRKATAGFRLTYYRSKRDLDVESFILGFRAAYEFYDGYKFEAMYNVENFDDFLVRDKYYTANIVEIRVIKNISF